MPWRKSDSWLVISVYKSFAEIFLPCLCELAAQPRAQLSLFLLFLALVAALRHQKQHQDYDFELLLLRAVGPRQ